MTDTEEGQNNPPVISISFQLCRAGRPPFTPRSLHLTASSEQTNSLGVCSSLHVLCALCHLGAGSSTTVPAVRTHSSGFLLLLGECVLALSTVKVFAGDVSDCAAPQQSQMLCTENTKAGKMCLSPSPRTPLCESWCSHQQSHPRDSSPTLHKVLMNLRAFSPQDLLSLHLSALAANKGANSPQLLERYSCMALSATCKRW